MQAKRSRVEEDDRGTGTGSRDISGNGTGSGNGGNDPRWSGEPRSGPAPRGGGGAKVPVFKNSIRDSSSLEIIYFLLYIEEVCCSSSEWRIRPVVFGSKVQLFYAEITKQAGMGKGERRGVPFLWLAVLACGWRVLFRRGSLETQTTFDSWICYEQLLLWIPSRQVNDSRRQLDR